MKQLRFIPSMAAVVIGMQPYLSAYAAPASSVSEMLSEGDTSLSFRYRYEFVDQDGVEKNAGASTLKTRLTYKSASFKGLTALMEVDNVTVIGDENYRTPTNGNTDYPIVADPDGTDFNQIALSYQGDDYMATAGRQRIIHSSQRFVGGVAFRQNEQTYDALTVSSKAGPIDLNYSYIWNVNRIFGPKDSAVQAKRWESDSHILYASMSPAKGQTISGYAYLLDFDNAAANSTSTYGVEYSGKFSDFSLKAAYAVQSDYGDNSLSYDAEYMMAEISIPLKPVSVALGYELLGSDDGKVGFKTPLATLHKFQGWADKFLGTPANGIEDTYVKLSGNVGGTKIAVIYHDFSADFGGADFGSELDIVASYPIKKNLSVELKYASYDADTYATNTDKLWFTFSAKY
ncbi:MAG: hypothetical protein V7708_13670 [Oceanicoccus sp.]